jgi:hypothetical protein
MPSNGNVQGQFAHVELALCKVQARTHLNQLREIIANKSFQYSDVI